MVGLLAKAGCRVLASATTGYGGVLLQQAGAGEVRVGSMDVLAMTRFIEENGVDVVVDATHPFAVEARANAQTAAAAAGTMYIRLEREAEEMPENPLVVRVPGYEEAARLSASLGEVIFLTTGSKTLGVFIREAVAAGRRLVARVLPQPDVVSRCLALGLAPRDVIAMQGPFSRELNRAMFREYGARVVVTKDSGPAGGLKEKVLAALDLGLPVVVVQRPPGTPAADGHALEADSRCRVVRRAEEVVRLVCDWFRHGAQRVPIGLGDKEGGAV